MESLPPQFGESANYPIVANSTDATTVVAVKTTSVAALDSVVVVPAGLGVGGLLRLHDDGESEDIAAGDGVFTSGRFQANKSEGVYEINVLSYPTGGGVVTQSVSVEAVASNAKFIDVSSSTGDLYSAAPVDSTSLVYSAVYFSSKPDSADAKEFLVITVDDMSSHPLFLEKVQVLEGGPFYQDAGQLLNLEIPTGGRGVACADFDNDGDIDFFVCGVDSAALYENRVNEAGEGVFVNVTSSAFGFSGASLGGSIAASWGDYNRDGLVDLFLAKTDYSGSVRSLSSPGSQQYETLVFRNTGRGTFSSTSFGESGTGNVCLAGCWVDLNNDDNLELVTVGMVGDYPTVYENTGFSSQDGDFQLVSGSWSTVGTSNGAGSVSVVDYNHDAYPDLLVTEVSGPGRAMILVNNYDAVSQSKSFSAVELAEGGSWSGAVVSDFDLNGQEDYLLLPKQGEAALYMSAGYSSTPQYRDLAYTLGLRAGPTSGAIVGDFNGDHDVDLYLGRLKGTQFQYKNVRQNTAEGDTNFVAAQKWVGINLETTGSTGGGLIGAEVSVHTSTRRWTQTVDGGSGRSGQRTGSLIFGLGDIQESQVGVRVRYRSGEVDSTGVGVGQVHTFVENETIVLKTGSKNDPKFEFELGPGYVVWVFTWQSINVRGRMLNDVVLIENINGYTAQDPCYIGVDSGTPREFKLGDPGVTSTVYWDGTYWQHVLLLGIESCATGCSHRFSVTSTSGNGVDATIGPKTTSPTTICLPEIEE